jgi:hypothetical protein
VNGVINVPPPGGVFDAQLLRIEKDIDSRDVRLRAWRMCAGLNRELRSRTLTGIDPSVRAENGAVVFELSNASFILFFSIEKEESDSGWGLATHRASGGNLAGGPLSSASVTAVLDMILPRRNVYRLRSSEASSGLLISTK